MVLEAAYPAAGSPATIAGWDAEGSKQVGRCQQLTGVVIVVSLVIAGCALAASVVAGLAGRGCPFSRLRLAGTPLSVLQRAVALERAVPLLVTAVVAIGTGFAAWAMFTTAQLRYPLVYPGAGVLRDHRGLHRLPRPA
jgi:hypothetical protein